LRNLRRRAIGSFGVTDAVPLDALSPDDALPMADLLVHLPGVTVDTDGVDAVGHGRPLYDDAFLGLVADRVRVLSPDGDLIGVYRPDGERLVADVVLLGG
jgi:hypothetical protein